MNNFKPRSKVLLEVMSGRSSSAQTRVVRAREEDLSSSSRSTRVDDAREEEEENTDLSQMVKLPRRSGRVIRKPDRCEANVIVPNTNDEDPASYQEAMVDPDRDEWQSAMNQEMESMDFNSV